MTDKYWLDFRCGGPGLQSHVLAEREEAYDGVEHARRMVMLIRGKTPASFAGGFQRSKQVHLVPMGPIVLTECALHLRDSTTKVKTDPRPGSTQLHSISANALTSPAELAHRLYALSLAPMCTAIILAEGEFEGLGELTGVDAIVQMLVTWTRIILACGNSPRYRPQVVVFRRRLAKLSGDLVNRMTGEVLATSNAARELTAKGAQRLWKQCFSGIVEVPAGLEDELSVCKQAIAASSGVDRACPAVPGHSMPSLLHAACAQFSFNYRPFNVILASRLFPIPKDLPRQLHILFRHASATPASIMAASRVAASALIKDVYFAKLLGEQRAPFLMAYFEPNICQLLVLTTVLKNCTTLILIN